MLMFVVDDYSLVMIIGFDLNNQPQRTPHQSFRSALFRVDSHDSPRFLSSC